METQSQVRHSDKSAKHQLVTARSIVVAVLLLVGSIVAITIFIRQRSVTLRGAVMRNSDDPARESVISGADVTVSGGALIVKTNSDNSGAFALTVRRSVLRRQSLTLEIRHAGYEPYDIRDPTGNQLYVVKMTPVPEVRPADQAPIKISNVSVRYTVKANSSEDVGTGTKVFQVLNKGNVPCNRRLPCSPNGKWRASMATATLDAGPEIQFRDGRVSCIAGPCAFTRIEHDGFSKGGRVISVTVLDWSDTTTFLLQAEAVRYMVADATRKSFPVIFERTMNFSLPNSAEGIAIEADVDGNPIVFPIVPDLSLSWAGCVIQGEPGNSTLYRCELKPGYEFH